MKYIDITDNNKITDREYAFWLNNIPGVGYVSIGKLLDYFGSYENVYKASEEELSKVEKLDSKKINNILESKDIYCIKQKIEVYESRGYKFVLRYESNYPKRLKDIYAPPHILYYRGSLPKEDVPSIAIIGARECTNYGMHYALKLAYELANHGFQIISGLARGIDTAAHKGAIMAQYGATFGVLGCGVDICYPPSNINTYMGMMDRGGIISECPIGASPVAGNFPRRNRIISGLCDGILVVEARKKSGSLITVDIALEQGKEIYTIPGAISSSLSEGCNNIIKLGAKVVTSVDDILEDFSDFIYRRNMTLKDSNLIDELETDSKKSKIFLESKEKIVYASLCFESKHIDDIVCETGLSIGEVIKILFGLEEKNLVVQTQSNYYERLNMG